jgi:formamidopyrimidine-DNA glycosylase
MPELPEVEVIRRGLQNRLPGSTVSTVETRDKRVFLTPRDEIESRLRGQTVQTVERRGKFLLIRLDRDILLVHLGMTGQLTYWDKNRSDSPRFLVQPATGLQQIRQHRPDKHTHMTVHFVDGNALNFRDIRQFGNVRLFPEGDIEQVEPIRKLGMEPLTDEFQYQRFRDSLKKTSRVIKAVLLDQRIVAGVGNIYADESLFYARLRPTWRADRLSAAETRRLFEAIPRALQKGIELGGTSLRDYVDSDGQQGSNQEELMVYGRAGEPCRNCRTPITKTVVAQRGTHFCAVCQRRGAAR